MTTKQYINILSQVAEKNGRPFEMALSDWCDYLIRLFDENFYVGGFPKFQEKFSRSLNSEPQYATITLEWCKEVEQEMDKGQWLDLFGELYEEAYLVKKKASDKGQFFTPHSLCDIASEIVGDNHHDVNSSHKVSDYASGSGRLLLAHFVKQVCSHGIKTARLYHYEAADNDILACKMCALNMMIHGMQGKVTCQDSLLQDEPKVIYIINNVRYPIASPYYSIKTITPTKKEE